MGGRQYVDRLIKYTPLPSQRRFRDCQARFKGFSGPIGSGKSQALCQEAIRLAYINAGRTGLIGAPTYPMLRDATQRSLLQTLDDNAIPYELNKAEQILTFTDTGSTILFRPVEEFDRLRGTNLAWFGIDELTYTPEEAWTTLEGRLRDPRAERLCGFGVWTPKGKNWVWQRFVGQPISGYEVIIAEPFENHHLLSKIPDFYKRLRASYDERFFSQEVLGEYLDTRDSIVYFAFDRTKHVCSQTAETGRPLLWALDFNVDPMSSIVAQKVGNQLRVLDEIVLRRATTEQACNEFLARWGGHFGGLVIYGDASGNRMQTTGNTDYEIIRRCLRQYGAESAQYRVPKVNPSVRDRISLMNSLLAMSDTSETIQVDPRCKELIRDFEEVEYKAGTTVIDKEKNPKRTHLSDALGYLAWQEFRQGRYVGEQNLPLL